MLVSYFGVFAKTSQNRTLNQVIVSVSVRAHAVVERTDGVWWTICLLVVTFAPLLNGLLPALTLQQ
jgi:hypothetical protein